jgi:hypothetical protein
MARDARDLVIEMLADSEAALREQIGVLRTSVVDLAWRCLWSREAFVGILTNVDEHRLAAVRERDRLAEENARLREENARLRAFVLSGGLAA